MFSLQKDLLKNTNTIEPCSIFVFWRCRCSFNNRWKKE